MSKGAVTGRTAAESRERDILYRVIQIASSSLRTDGVLREVVQLVTEAVAADACLVYLWDRDLDALVLRACSPAYEDCIDRVRLRAGEGVAGWATEHRESVLLRRNARADPRYRSIPELEGEQYEAMLSVPIIARSADLIGAINVHGRTAGQFSDEDMRFLESTASLLAGGIENAQLFQLAQHKEEALAALMRKTIQVQEEERRRVATEIHDGVTQQLVSIWFRVHACQRLLERAAVEEALREVRATKDLIDHTLVDARSAIYDLRPATLDDLGLVAALHELASRFREDAGIDVTIRAPNELRVSPHLETALYRITQEALTNIRKHARAREVVVALRTTSGSVELEVRDNGAGFDLDAFSRSRTRTSFGLAGMRERIELVGGQLAIRSAPGEGTTLRAAAPIEGMEVVA